jgi:hypothetical protein
MDAKIMSDSTQIFVAAAQASLEQVKACLGELIGDVAELTTPGRDRKTGSAVWVAGVRVDSEKLKTAYGELRKMGAIVTTTKDKLKESVELFVTAEPVAAPSAEPTEKAKGK